jgi:hypothetical protein
MSVAVVTWARCAALAFLLASGTAHALNTEEVAALCKEADGVVHCGRLIEAVQLKRLPNLARRDGDTLFVRLYPTGEAELRDVSTLSGGTTFALFDYVNEFNAVVLWTTTDNDVGFALLQRASGKQTALPAQPVPAPSGGRFATADFCEARCENQLVVWQVARDGARRELTWKPPLAWADAEVRWKDPDTVIVEYTAKGSTTSAKLERRLSDPSWTREAR